MTKKIAVCDDEKTIIRQIETYLKQIAKEENEEFDILYYGSGEELLKYMPLNIDILLLDISMDQLNGIQTAKKLRENGYDSYIVFITGMTEYAIQGYEVHAFAFLQKPLMFADLCKVIHEILQKQNKQNESFLLLDERSETHVLKTSEILYAEVYHHTSILTFANGKKEYRISLNDIEDKLKDRGFYRVHKSYLINMKKIRKISFDNITLENGDLVPLSKHRRKDFLAAYSLMIGGSL